MGAVVRAGASQWYRQYWVQCTPMASPADYLSPGLTEAAFFLGLVNFTTALNLPPCVNLSVCPALYPGHLYFYWFAPNWWRYTPAVSSFWIPQPLENLQPPPYQPPLDFDPMNRAALAALPGARRYKSQTFLVPVVPGVVSFSYNLSRYAFQALNATFGRVLGTARVSGLAADIWSRLGLQSCKLVSLPTRRVANLQGFHHRAEEPDIHEAAMSRLVPQNWEFEGR